MMFKHWLGRVIKTVHSISTEAWSCPATTGDRPPPSVGHYFTAVDDRRAVVFGGLTQDEDLLNDVYIIDLISKVFGHVCGLC